MTTASGRMPTFLDGGLAPVTLAAAQFGIGSRPNVVCSKKHALWDRQPDHSGRFEIDDELQLRRSLHRQLASLCTVKYSDHELGDTTKHRCVVGPVGEDTAGASVIGHRRSVRSFPRRSATRW